MATYTVYLTTTLEFFRGRPLIRGNTPGSFLNSQSFAPVVIHIVIDYGIQELFLVFTHNFNPSYSDLL